MYRSSVKESIPGSRWLWALAVLLAMALISTACSGVSPAPTSAVPAAPTSGISGSLKSATGEPIAQGEVTIWKGPAYTASVGKATTDAAGNYVLPMPTEPGDYRIVPTHPEYSFNPVFSSATVKPDVPLLVFGFTGQKGSVLRLVLSPLGTQMPTPNSLAAIVYKEAPSFEAPNADAAAMTNKEADGSYYLNGLLKENNSYYTVCPVARGYVFEPECAGVNTPGRPGIATLSFNYKPR